VAQALATMTLAFGDGEETQPGGLGRVILVEGVERWRGKDVEEHLGPALAGMEAGTTVALFAREDGRTKAPAEVHEAVRRAGGQVVAQSTVKPWELGGWAREQGARLGVSLDGAAAKALVAQVGERQQRLLRELEKLALSADASTEVRVEDIERLSAHSAEWRAYSLADALVGGDPREATLAYMRVREQGERLSGLIYLMAQRLREALAIALRLSAGESAAEVKRGLRMPARAAERFVADVARSDPDRLRRALGALADLELDSRGGAAVSTSRSTLAALSEDTLALQAIRAITS
jgi:DNA polymerase-3 subunit delta